MRLIDADKLDYMLKLALISTSTSITDEGLKLARSVINDMSTVEAIPIEWLRMWFTKGGSLMGIVLMGEIESDWEKENEID